MTLSARLANYMYISSSCKFRMVRTAYVPKIMKVGWQ